MLGLRCCILLILISVSNISFSQTERIDTVHYVDENGKFQGYWKLPDAFNYSFKEKRYGGYEAMGEGYFKDGKRVGTWKFTSDRGDLLGFRLYEENGNYIEVQLRNKKPLSIIKFEKISDSQENDSTTFEVVEILSFNKQGKFVKRYSARETEND